MHKIRLFKPSVGQSEINSIKKVFKSSWLGYGPLVKKFEKNFASFIGTKYAVAVNSGTAALHLALLSYNFKRGKKVLVPAITFSATAATVMYCGLEPKFVDVKKETLTIDIDDLNKKYSSDCVAIVCVHMGGQPCDMKKIKPWAKKKKIILIEDCAETCGSSISGKKIGTWSDISCFSFEEKKIITTGDGGMLCLNDKKQYDKIKSLSFHGWNSDPWSRHNSSFGKKNSGKHWKYEIVNLGYKYNMNDLMASIGLIQLKKINQLNDKRANILKKYLIGIKNCKYIKPLYPYDLKDSSYWLFAVKTKFRNELIDYLKIKNISTAVHFVPLPLNKLYKKYKSKIPNSMIIWKQMVSLPFFPDLKEKEIDYIIKNLNKFDKKLQTDQKYN
ncbi:DegT/DnrJ/EryC1/StrS family aminotransferase [Pelagibacteraceae bacterium]|nr:DegT/DnrJ/EryC1/StrS family aminotransferase [Pelagibacteraceae bacterium]